MAASLTNLACKRTVRGRTIRYATFLCRVYVSIFHIQCFVVQTKYQFPRRHLWRGDLSPMGCAAAPMLSTAISQVIPVQILGAASQPIGDKSPRHKSPHNSHTPETTKATRRWPLFGEASAKREAYLTAQPVSSARALPMSASERTVLTPASCSAANFSSAVPLPPEMIAPAWPMRLPGGAVTPAM